MPIAYRRTTGGRLRGVNVGRVGRIVACSAVLAAGVASCSSSTTGSPATTTVATALRPAGPAAVIGGPLTGGSGVSLLSGNPGPSLSANGYTQAEFTASGTATAYRATSGRPTDGRVALVATTKATYRTRIVVRRPASPVRFNGTVVVEWLNVSSGSDAAPEYTYVAEDLLRAGFAWVGVSAQQIGVQGGPVAVQVPGVTGDRSVGLTGTDPARYSSLHHPGDAYSYDIYTQVGRALRDPGAVDPLHGLDVKHLLAVGESQSAIMLTTYVNGVQPLEHEYDGFLIHSRSGAQAPLGVPGAGIDIAQSIAGVPTIIRTDQQVPVMLVQTETDVLGVLGYFPARQPDNAHLRLWEMAGTAHADKFQVGAAESLLGCSLPINRGQQNFVLDSTLAHLDEWVDGRTPPPVAPRLDVSTSGPSPVYVRDAVGNVTGGIRTPAVEAPVDVLSGLPAPDSSLVCLLSGSTTPVPAARLATLYPDRAAYLADYRRATDAAIRAGFILPADRTSVLADAQPQRIQN